MGELYPEPGLLARFRRAGVPATLSSDAHAPQDVARDFATAVAALRGAGYETITRFSGREPPAGGAAMGVSGMRIGSGIDAHRFGPGRPLMLGTIEVEHPEGLVGHSDGDVVAHALCDALLAAAGEPDIGAALPVGRRRSGRASRARGCSRWSATGVREAGWAPVNAHAIVLCERPRVAPHRAAMEAAMTRHHRRARRPSTPPPPTASAPSGARRGDRLPRHRPRWRRRDASRACACTPRSPSARSPWSRAPTAPCGIYVCGPTVYGPHPHRQRPAVRRLLGAEALPGAARHPGALVSNLTDINDKIYDAAKAEGIRSDELARRYSDAYIADTDRLGLGRPDAEPRVTETMPEIIELIATLVEQGPGLRRRRATSTTASSASRATGACRAAGSTR